MGIYLKINRNKKIKNFKLVWDQIKKLITSSSLISLLFSLPSFFTSFNEFLVLSKKLRRSF